MLLPDLITRNNILLNNKHSSYVNNQTYKFSFKSQPYKDEFTKVSFNGYDRSKLSSEEILKDVAMRLLESINRPLTERIPCNKGYLPLEKNVTPLGEYKLDIATGVRSFRVLKYPDHYELHKNVYSEDEGKLIKVNVLRLFSDRLIFHSTERKTPLDSWGKPIENLETTDPQIINLYVKFFDRLTHI